MFAHNRRPGSSHGAPVACQFVRERCLAPTTRPAADGHRRVGSDRRLIHPPTVEDGPVLVVAVIGVAVIIVASRVLAKANRSSLNVEGGRAPKGLVELGSGGRWDAWRRVPGARGRLGILGEPATRIPRSRLYDPLSHRDRNRRYGARSHRLQFLVVR